MTAVPTAPASPRAWMAAATFAIAGLLSAPAVLATDPERAHFVYDVAPGCPVEADFLDLVLRDGGSLVRAGSDEPARTFTITIAGGFPVMGRLVVRGVDGTAAVRTITGDHCDEVTRALAVLVALSVHPATPSEGPIPPMVTADPRQELPSPAQSEPSPNRWRVGLSLGIAYGAEAGAALVPGYAGYLEFAYDSASVVSPSFRLGAEVGTSWRTAGPSVAGPIIDYGPAMPATAQTAYLTTQKTVARLDGCPFRWVAAQPWDTDALIAQTCARVDVGRLDASSSTFSTDSVRAWVALGATVRARWAFPRVFFEGEGGAMFPLTRERYYVQTTDLFVVPAVAAVMNFGVGVFVL